MCSTTISSSLYEAKRELCDLGLCYETIHACKYDCVIVCCIGRSSPIWHIVQLVVSLDTRLVL